LVAIHIAHVTQARGHFRVIRTMHALGNGHCTFSNKDSASLSLP
jgi:hypothetical protein